MNDTPTAAPMREDVMQATEPCEGGAHCCCCKPDQPCCDCGKIIRSRACMGEKCWCGAAAAKKVGEEILFDDPEPARHNLTAYICAPHYAQMMGPRGAEQVGTLNQNTARPDASHGHVTAFYEIATMLGIGAQAASPADVWRDQMRPKLEALTAQRAPAEGEQAALFQEAASLIYRVASAGAIAHEGVAFERWKNTARDLAPRLTAVLAPTAEPAGKASRFDPPGLWESEPRSSAAAALRARTPKPKEADER